MTCFWGHNWTKWEVIEEGRGKYVLGGGDARYLIQRRRCRKCDKVEQEKIIT